MSDLPVNSLSEVFPQLPVIDIILLDRFSLKMEDASVKNFKVSFTTIVFLDFIRLLTIAKDAPLASASLTNKLPSLFLPLIAKKTLFFFISLELIDDLLIFIFGEILF